MNTLAIAMAALLAVVLPSSRAVTIKTALVQPRVLSGVDLQVNNDQLTVLPGACRVGDVITKVVAPTTLKVGPAEQLAVENEEYELTTDAPDRWIKGTHLKGCLSTGATSIPGCLIPGSVVVKLADGSQMREGRDYRLDTRWAALSRIESGGIPKGQKVRISYRVGLMRLDSVVVSATGKVSLVKGKPDRTTPLPPEIAKDSLRVANVFMPPGATTLTPPQVFVIADGFAEADDNLLAVRTTLLSKMLAKLRGGSSVTIVAWGDSVTAGGDASSPAKAFPQLFATRLGERFPKSRIKLVNAGIGATNTMHRLPTLQKEVMSHQPDLVLVEFVNDMDLPEATVRQNLDSAFEQIQASGAEIILMTPHFTMPEMMRLDLWRGKESRPMVGVLRKIAEEKAVGLADVSSRWEHLEKEGLPYITLLKNGINHPDDRGHELFVKELLSFFPADPSR